MMGMGELGTKFGSILATSMFVWAIFKEYFPHGVRGYVEKYTQKLVRLVYPYIEINFHELTGERLKRSEAYAAIQNYLNTKASSRASKFKADVLKESKSLILTMDDHEEITDEFNGAKVWWLSDKQINKSQTISYYPVSDERRFFKLSFHKRHRQLITGAYIEHVIKEGKAVSVKNRQRKLYSNNPSKNWSGWKSNKWSHVYFEHPATFDTLAMESTKKEKIMNDLKKFRGGKEYYKKIGKAWKRGYLLYGPPGTGKSTMIAAMANFLNYDVYDLELTTVMDNTELRNLLIETTNQSIIVIEDIDCSLDLTGQRVKKKEKVEGEEEVDPIKKKEKEENENNASKVTLSGLLNFIDGLWSACGGERIIVFTTNYVEKLDPALIRRGRMDKHIEMSYCSFEAFKVLANNYLDIQSHELFAKIGDLLAETSMTPADVAENLMPKSDEEDVVEACLNSLIEALEETKEEARKKKEEEKARVKAEKEEKEKKESGQDTEKVDEIANSEVKENGFHK